jgi:hypothetical protein
MTGCPFRVDVSAMRVGGVVTWFEFVPIYFDVRRAQARPKFIKSSEIETVGCQKHRNEEAGSTKHGDHSEHIDVRLGC